MEITTKIIKRGYEEARIVCPVCDNNSSGYFDKEKVVKIIGSFIIVDKNQLQCEHCKTIFKIMEDKV